MATGIPKGYTRSTLEKMNESRTKLKLQTGLASNESPDELANFEVWRYTSSKRLDEGYGNHARYLSGTAPLVAVQASAIKALHDELSLRMGFAATFEEWFEEWQLGFKNLINRPGSDPTLKTNYPIQDTGDREGWRTDPESRPQYLEWKLPKANRKFRVIEYFPRGRSEPTNSIVCSGSDSQIINQIVYYEWMPRGVEEEERFIPVNISNRQGYPIIRLYFKENSSVARVAGRNPGTGWMSFRVMQEPKQLAVSDLQRWKSKIEENFKPNGNPVSWKKGKSYYTYADWKNGYQFQILADQRPEAESLIKKALAIKEDTFKRASFYNSGAVYPDETYSDTKEYTEILGQVTPEPLMRPRLTVNFKWADLFLPTYNKKYTLVTTPGCRKLWPGLKGDANEKIV
ncbi:MAG: hypothetical protein F6K48_15895 [Okeania sp. SIO3H1]|uniref:hypothetical protein n=1 Tax=Okeania sp. SIO1I7 TaxID=2607772 RepID=UPI0013C62DE9|nr:hypothetical protein [Okeania sp. SIO1I7]NEN90310.1 hypothetical protein [Okeania sp. SIO3H1]NET29529.1 hypothetical protein [Okeania sp. SIO1I7]